MTETARVNWVLLRGLTRQSGHWGDFALALQNALPGANVVVLDLPGNGSLRHLRSPWSIAQMVESCRATLRNQGCAPPYAVLAMSMGAMVTAQWAHTVPQELAAAVLVNTSFRPFNPVYQRLRPRNYGSLLRMLLLRPSDETQERTVLHMTSNHPERHQAALADWIAMHQRHPVSAGNALRQLAAAARFRAHLQAPQCPVLLLGSERDRLVNVACTRAIAQRWASPMALHPDAGHDLPLDAPQWVIEQVRPLHQRLTGL
jgi:pimeloyl-ACP methyl ester carboxylesterase